MSGAGSDHPINRLIHQLAESRRPATAGEIEAIREHVASVGFDPTSMARVGDRISGLVWGGRVMHADDRLPNGQVHYLKHVMIGQEWPPGTRVGQYVESLRRAIRDPRGGIAIDSRFGFVRLTFVARSFAYQGPAGGEWILVGYTVDYGSWVTGYQPDNGLRRVVLDESKDGRWLRRPTS